MAVVSPHRQPFAELGASRLQSLSSAKNRQNALTDLLSPDGKEKQLIKDSKSTLASPSKRRYSLSIYEDANEDSENIDPVSSPSIKRTKNVDGLPIAKAEGLFSLDVNRNPTSPLKQRSTPKSINFPSAPSSAPVGRLMKPKSVGLLSKKRSSFSPFKRVDPPPFCSNKNKPAGLPFSIDAAISGTLANKSTHSSAATATKQQHVPLLEEAMPKGWFFDIHEDTPDEEAAIMMEHSTCTLDISSDDEAGPSRAKDDRGKENIPPPPDMVPALAGNTTETYATTTDVLPVKPRRSIHVDVMADEGEERAPLGSLPAEDFYAQGLDKDSVEVINETSGSSRAALQQDPETPIVDDEAEDNNDTAAHRDVAPIANKENVQQPNYNEALESLLAPSSPVTASRLRFGSANTSLADTDMKPDFTIAEDPVDAVKA